MSADQAVAAACGWHNLDMGHGFHPTKQGERYILSETARRTVLDRLLDLNHQRCAEELKARLHDEKRGGGRVGLALAKTVMGTRSMAIPSANLNRSFCRNLLPP